MAMTWGGRDVASTGSWDTVGGILNQVENDRDRGVARSRCCTCPVVWAKPDCHVARTSLLAMTGGVKSLLLLRDMRHQPLHHIRFFFRQIVIRVGRCLRIV